jgi:hypothetical protein
MHILQSKKKLKVTMDDDVFSLFEQPDYYIPVDVREGLRQEGIRGQTRLLGGAKEREALKIIFKNRNSFQLKKLTDVTKEEISPLIKQKTEELSNYFEDDELDLTERQLLAEAENAKIDVLLTFSPIFVEQGKKLRKKGIVEVEIMKPSEYVRKYL